MIDRYNYQCTQEFLQFLMDVKGLKEKSVTRYKHHLNHLLHWAQDCRLWDVMTRRPTFLTHVKNLSKKDGSELSMETKSRVIETARRFFDWAKLHRAADFRKMPAAWIDTIQMPKSESQQKENEYVSFDEIIQIARIHVEQHDLVMQRDQAAAVMLFLSGMRAGAFASIPIRAFDLEHCSVYQWPEYGVKTKNAKKATTYLLPIPELLEVVNQWNTVVSSALPDTAPWYAPIKNEWGEQSFSHDTVGKNRATALNKRLKILFKVAGLPYRSAHKFRHGYAVYGLQHAVTMEDYKAVSMNMMHMDVRTTDSIYARLLTNEVGNRIATMTPTEVQLSNTNTTNGLDGLSGKELQKKVLEDLLREMQDA